jgi:hypothetical protein
MEEGFFVFIFVEVLLNMKMKKQKGDMTRIIRLVMMGLGVVMMTLAFQSCMDDENEPPTVIEPTESPNALVTVKPNAGNIGFILQLNDSTQLFPVNMSQSPFGTKEVRALVNYRKAGREELEKVVADTDLECVYINWIDSIPTIPMLMSFAGAEENLKKYGSDPLELIDDWMTTIADGYLTVHFTTRMSGNVRHAINLVQRADVNTPYYFTLYHDAKGDVTGQLGEALTAFKLADGVIPSKDSEMKTLTLEWTSYSGTKTAQIKFRN